MRTRSQQQAFLVSIAQGFDVGDFDYMPPQDMAALNILIAEAWQAFSHEGDGEAQIGQIEQFIQSKR